MLGIVTRRRVLWLVLTLAALVVLTLGALVFVFPSGLVHRLAIWQLESTTGRPVTIEALDLSVATGRFSVRGFRINDPDGGLLAEFDRLEGRFHRRSLLRGHLWIEALALTGGHVRIVRIGPNRFNISDLLERPAGRRMLDVSVDHFSVTDGRVALEDRTLTPARTWHSDDIRLDAREITTLGRRGTAVGSTTIAGSLISLRVDELQLAPVHLRAWVNVRDVDLRLAALYVPPDAPIVLARGTLDAGFALALDAREGLRVDAEAVVNGLALRRPGIEGDALTAPALQVLVRDFHHRADAVALRYASVGGDVTVLDPTSATPRRLTFSDLTATASGLEQPTTGLTRVAIHANVPGGGEVDIGGTAGLTPRRADVRVRARGVELATIGRYLPIAGQLDGVARTDVRVNATDERGFSLTVAGDVTLERVALGDGARTLAGAARVSATALQYTWPATVRVGQLTVRQPAVTLERDANGVIDLTTLVTPRAEPAGEASAPSAGPPGARWAVDLGISRLRIEDGRALVTDAASGARVDARRIALAAEDLAWPGRGPARVQASAAIAGLGELSAQGTVDAGQRGADLAVRVREADLATLQPWLPIAGRVRGVADADVRVVASHDGTLRLAVTGDTTLRRFALLDGRRPLAAAVRVAATGAEYTWPATVRVARLTVTEPSATVARDAAGAIELAALLRPTRRPDAATPSAAEEAAKSAAADVTVTQLRIDDGRAVVTDAATGGRVEVARLAVRARDVSWPARGTAPVRLTAAVAGGEVTARGTVDAGQRRGELAVTLRGADLAALQPWLPITGRVRGAADADLTVVAALDPFALRVRGTAGAADLAFLEGDQPLLTVGRVDATGVDLQWPTQLAVDGLRVNAPWAKIERTPQGELSLRRLFARRPGLPAAPAETKGDAGLVAGLQLSVRDALFENGGLSIVDDAVEPAARFELKGSRLALRDLTWPARGAATVQISTPMPGREGTLRARGTFSIEPTRLALDVDLDQVDLAPGRPYLPIDARLGGRLSGRAKVTGTFGDTISLVIAGDATAERLTLGDDLRRLATVRRVELAGMRYQYPTSLRVKQLTLERPWLLLERDSSGTFELAALFAARNRAVTGSSSGPGGRPGPGADGTTAPIRKPRVRLLVGTLTMQEGFVRFVDRASEPDFVEEISAIALTAEGLGTRQSRNGKVTLRGTFASGTPLSVHGELGSLLVLLDERRFVDVTVDVRDYPVPRLNPYLRRHLGWLARQGRLTAGVHYRIAGYDLEATNDIRVVGLDVERPDDPGQGAGGPPLDTIVSLLKNRDGVIRLDVPVRGSLLAPDFDYSDAVWTAVRNLAIRLVALPFSLVGKLFYTKDSHIDSVAVYPVPFPVAGAVPTPEGAQQLDRLVTFLKQASAVRLRLRPVTTVADVTALRRQALQSRLAGSGADPTTRRQAAVGLYAELFPRRQPPASDEALLEELTRETPTPPRALRTLAADRVAATRDALIRAGIAPERLEPVESRTAVESEGVARVEFEIAPD
jgi:uncharacterized protein involved in outer membrane biogenesis